ncbi:glycosyltransferase family 2 protein [Pikeienuella sp. HZG-20]|uniref:glycosyltransferase family 2 protein n=1 Tax=Paludibacillus litoralis TaxID=3133267 RepID=UPI0030ED35E2
MSGAATGAAPRLAVIIPHYNDLTRLGVCLEALAPQLRRRRAEVECVVVDNDSPCDLAPVTAAYPEIRVLVEVKKGAAEARNRGVAETTAPNLLFIDSDCVAAPDWLETGLALAGSDEVIGGRVDTFDETPPPRSGAEAFETVFAFHQKTYVEKKGFSVTANLLTTRAVFEATGPMRAGLSEDVDWSRRAAAAGYPLRYVDELAVSHPTRRDWPALARKFRRTTDEGFLLNGVTPAARVKWLLRAALVLGSGVLHVGKILRSPKLASGLERRRAAATLLRIRAARCGWMIRQALTGKPLGA